jgi:WD40 repeat protein
VGELVVSPDGHHLASVGRQAKDPQVYDGICDNSKFDPEVCLWDLPTGRLIGKVQAYSIEWVKMKSLPSYTKLLFLTDGTLLTCSGNVSPNVVRWWDAATVAPLPDFPMPLDRFIAFGVSPDGKTLAGATEIGRICMFDVATGTEKLPAEAHRADIESVAFSTDGKTVLTGASDGARGWDAATGRPVARYRLNDPRLGEMTISGNGNTVVSQSWERGRTAAWDIATGRLLHDFGALGGTIAPSNDGSTVATRQFKSEGSNVAVWNVREGKANWHGGLPKNFRDNVPVYGLAISFDGRRLIAADGEVSVFEIETGRQLACWNPGQTGAVNPNARHGVGVKLAPTPDGAELAFGSEDTEEMVIVHALTGKPRLRIPTESPAPLVFSPDGRTLATGGGWQGKAVCLWDVRDGKLIRELPGKPTCVRSLAFSPDCKRLAAGCDDGTGVVWDLSNK